MQDSKEFISCIQEKNQDKKLALCFGFEYSPSNSSKKDKTGALILTEILSSDILSDCTALVVSSSYHWISLELNCIAVDKDKIEQKIGFDDTAFIDYSVVCSILSELEVLSLRRKFFRQLNYSDRRYTLINKIRFWVRIFKDYPVKIYINSNVPHLIDDYIAYRLAKYYEIPTVSAYRLPIISGLSSRLMLFSDPLMQSSPLPLAQLKSCEANSLEDFFDFASIYESCILKKKDIKELLKTKGESSIKADKKKRSLNLKLRLTLTSLKSRARAIAKSIKSEQLRKRYQKYLSQMSAKCDYLYFPLHYQPEASSRPLGGLWADQDLLVETLAEALPLNMHLVVKEHPLQVQKRIDFREAKFYERITSKPRVNLVSHKINSEALIKGAKGVVTLTGTACLEAILKKKKCFVFGETPFKNGPGISCPSSFQELKDELYRLSVDEYIPPGDEEVQCFLLWLARHSVFGYLEPYTDPQLEEIWSEQENIAEVASAFILSIKHLLKSQ